MDKRFKTPEDRLANYTVSPAGCWEWQGALKSGGYGNIAELYGQNQAHRASYIHYVGPIPEGASLLHSCDNRRCINPAHLRPGTYSENQREAYQRGRRFPKVGSTNANAKLTEEQAKAIILDHRTNVAVAREYGVSQSLISAVRVGTAWKHLQAWRTANATKRAQMNLR